MNQSPTYLYQLVPPLRSVKYNLRGANVYESNVEQTNRFASTYFQNCNKEWSQLDVSIRSSQTISEIKRKLIQLVRPKRQSYFGVHDIEGIRCLTQLRVKFHDLREHRFRHNFHCLSPFCICGNGEENNVHLLLHCPWYVNQRKDYLDEVSNLIGSGILELTSNDLCTLLFYGNEQFDTVTNRAIIEATIQFIKVKDPKDLNEIDGLLLTPSISSEPTF